MEKKIYLNKIGFRELNNIWCFQYYFIKIRNQIY